MAPINSSGRDRMRWLFLPAAVIALAGAGIDIAQLLRGIPLWVDEEMIAINLRERSFSDLPGALWLAQSAPLAWLIVQRAVILTLGQGEIALRLLSVLFGIATLGAALWIGRRWLHPISAALLVLICVIGQWLSHFRFEVKHYSADTLWALLLPALAAWALEDDEEPGSASWRWTRWWAVAALAQWSANGAFLVTPGCAVFLWAVILRRHGIRGAMRFAGIGTIWLASLGIHYLLALQYAHGSYYLQAYWRAHVVPASMGLAESLLWVGGRLESLADNPGGASVGVWLWACAFCGFAFSPRRRLAGTFVTVPLAAFALAAFRLVPLNDRLAVWIVPSLYVGVVLLLDRGVRLLSGAWRPRRWAWLLAGAVTAGPAFYVISDITTQGYRNLDLGLPTDSNRGVDDRRAVRWLMDRRQPGDAVISSRLGWPALWWYGGIRIADRLPGARLPDGTVMYEVTHERESPGCRERLEDALKSHRRILVHVGFPDMPEGFYELLIRELAGIGAVVEEESFAYLSRTAVIERHGSGATTTVPPIPPGASGEPPLPGCVVAVPVRRW